MTHSEVLFGDTAEFTFASFEHGSLLVKESTASVELESESRISFLLSESLLFAECLACADFALRVLDIFPSIGISKKVSCKL